MLETIEDTEAKGNKARRTYERRGRDTPSIMVLEG